MERAVKRQFNCKIDLNIIVLIDVDARSKGISVSECAEQRLAQSLIDYPPPIPTIPTSGIEKGEEPQDEFDAILASM